MTTVGSTLMQQRGSLAVLPSTELDPESSGGAPAVVQSIGGQASSEQVDFFSMSRQEFAEFLKAKFGLPAFRAQQIFSWVYRKNVEDIEAMTDLSAELRAQLATVLRFPRAPWRDRQISSDGTRKYLFELDSGALIESVFIKQRNLKAGTARNTLCISSQVGCGMGCAFCRTATMGYQRHLSASEIVRQVRGALHDAVEFGDTFQNIVFMGMGEPLHNLKNVVRAIQVLRDSFGFGLGGRKITVSTSGLVPAIKKFGAANLDVNLAVSLNATTDEVRDQVMPINKTFPLQELLGCLKEFPLSPRKYITFEYVMLAGVNDTPADLERLPALMRGIRSKVNLIPYNSNAGLGFTAPSKDVIDRWYRRLMQQGINATIRWSKGPDIDAACGQLATETRLKNRAA
jgi:23S rRNA (adenine2503-C2)-methyltransferase